MLLAAPRDQRVKMNDVVMLTRIKIENEVASCEDESSEGEHWRTTGMATISDFERWRMVMTIHGGDHPWWCQDEIMRVVQWAVSTEWKNSGASWQWRWRRNIKR